MTRDELEALLAPPTEAEVERALVLFAAAVREAYGSRLEALYLFGSRARGDHRPDSDVDVAVVLRDEGWSLVAEKRRLARLATRAIVETGAHVQGWPIAAASWWDPTRHSSPALARNMRADARPLGLNGPGSPA